MSHRRSVKVVKLHGTAILFTNWTVTPFGALARICWSLGGWAACHTLITLITPRPTSKTGNFTDKPLCGLDNKLYVMLSHLSPLLNSSEAQRHLGFYSATLGICQKSQEQHSWQFFRGRGEQQGMLFRMSYVPSEMRTEFWNRQKWKRHTTPELTQTTNVCFHLQTIKVIITNRKIYNRQVKIFTFSFFKHSNS